MTRRTCTFPRVLSLALMLLCPESLASQESAACAAYRAGLRAYGNEPTEQKPLVPREDFERTIENNELFTRGTDVETAKKEYDLARQESEKYEREDEALRGRIRRVEGEIKNLQADIKLAGVDGQPVDQLYAELKRKGDEKKRLEGELSGRALYRSELRARMAEADRRHKAILAVEEARKKLRLIDAWDAHEKAMQGYKDAIAAKDAEFAAVQKDFAEVQKRFSEQATRLRAGPRDEAFRLAARYLRDQTATALKDLKKRLQDYDCWSDVSDFIVKTLEPRIFRLQPQKVALPSDADDDADLAELPDLDSDASGRPEGEGGTVGQGLANGQWSMACSGGAGQWTEGGTFQLTILANGTISGSYVTDGGQWPVTGTVGPGGTASGGGTDPSGLGSFAWGGTLTQASPGGTFTGSGNVSFRSNDGDVACGGTWSTK